MGKKKLFIGLSLASLLALTGCLRGTDTSSTSGGPGKYDPVGGYEEKDNYSANETGELQFNNGKVVYNDVKLKLFSICAGLDKYGLQDVVKQFNNDYEGEIEVEVEIEGQGSYETSIVTRITTDVGVPDILMFHNENLPSLQRNHLFQPIDRIIEKSKIDFNINQFASGVQDNNYVGEHLYGVSVDSHSEVVLYRADLLKKYNLQLPKTYDELINAAYTIQQGERGEGNDDFQGISISSSAFGTTQYSYYTAILQNGGSLLDTNNARPNWNSAANKQAMIDATNVFKNMFWGDKAVASYGKNEVEPDSDFATGKCAFSFVYTWMLDDIFRTFDKKFDETDRGITSLSGLLAKDPSKPCKDLIYGMSHGFYVPYNINDITKKAACVEFMKYFSEHSVSWNNWGHLPTHLEYSKSSEYLESEDTIEKTQYYGDVTKFKNFQFNYFLSIATGALDNIFTFSTKSASSDIESILKKYCDEANATIDMLI